jgi:hypothetical protein
MMTDSGDNSMSDLTFVASTSNMYSASGRHNVYHVGLSDVTNLWILSIWTKISREIVYSMLVLSYLEAVTLASAIDDSDRLLDASNVETAITDAGYITSWVRARFS